MGTTGSVRRISAGATALLCVVLLGACGPSRVAADLPDTVVPIVENTSSTKPYADALAEARTAYQDYATKATASVLAADKELNKVRTLAAARVALHHLADAYRANAELLKAIPVPATVTPLVTAVVIDTTNVADELDRAANTSAGCFCSAVESAGIQIGARQTAVNELRKALGLPATTELQAT